MFDYLGDPTEVEVFDIGSQVICDNCGKDWTGEHQTSGGFCTSGRAYCPSCCDSAYKGYLRHGEEKYVTGWCPPDTAFSDWVLELRGGNNTIKIISYK